MIQKELKGPLPQLTKLPWQQEFSKFIPLSPIQYYTTFSNACTHVRATWAFITASSPEIALFKGAEKTACVVWEQTRPLRFSCSLPARTPHTTHSLSVFWDPLRFSINNSLLGHFFPLASNLNTVPGFA